MIGVFNDEDPAVIDDWKKYGRRNIANLTIAPTGSISLLTRTTSGIEPLFCHSIKRRRKTEDPSKSVFKDEVGDMWKNILLYILNSKIGIKLTTRMASRCLKCHQMN